MFGASAHTSLRRLVLLASSAALVTSGALVAPAQAVTGEARTSSDWLVKQLDAGLVVTEYDDGTQWQQYTDYGLTLDVYYALGQLDVRAGQRRAILDAIEPKAAEYTDAWGTTYAGAMGKLLTAVELAGINPARYATGDLAPRLEDRVVTSGPETGRAKDDPDGQFESSNTFGQAFVTTALTGVSSPLADEARDFLLQQQCRAGYFREGMGSSDFTCDGGDAAQSRPSVDATATVAVALDALLDGPVAQPRRVDNALDDAIGWLLSRQRKDGSFRGGRNSNSTGLAATALALAGNTKRVAKAAAWIEKLQVDRRLVRRTAFRKRDLGAIAYDAAALARGKADGITRGDRYEWRRATAQAAPALDNLRR